jgi:hypothetical protein
MPVIGSIRPPLHAAIVWTEQIGYDNPFDIRTMRGFAAFMRSFSHTLSWSFARRCAT